MKKFGKLLKIKLLLLFFNNKEEEHLHSNKKKTLNVRPFTTRVPPPHILYVVYLR